jgi:hypothetical protein
VLRDPLHIVIGERNTTQHLVKQRLLFVGREAGKMLALRQLLKGGGVKPPVLVSKWEYCNPEIMSSSLALLHCVWCVMEAVVGSSFDGAPAEAKRGCKSKVAAAVSNCSQNPYLWGARQASCWLCGSC